MLLKAGLIVSVFMHMLWERLALIYAILGPPLLVLVFVTIGALEGDYTFLTRLLFFRADSSRNQPVDGGASGLKGMLSAKEGEAGISTSGGRPAPSCKVQEKAPKSQDADNSTDYQGPNTAVSMVTHIC